MIRIESNIGSVIAHFQYMVNSGLDDAIQRALQWPTWREGAQHVARKVLTALKRAGEESAIESMIGSVVHLFGPQTFTLTMSSPTGVVTAARAVMENAHVRVYGDTPRLRQVPLDISKEQVDTIDAIRDAVREWVTNEKNRDPERDAGLSDDEITDRLMNIMGLQGGRANWQGILAPLGPIQKDGTRKRIRGSGNQAEDGAGLARQIEDFIDRNPYTVQRPGMALPTLTAERVHDLLMAVLAAWVTMVQTELPNRVRAELRGIWTNPQHVLPGI